MSTGSNRISTKNHGLLPDRQSLQRICKAISVLDAIFSPDWDCRYYSYNSTWADQEECFEMRNGSGDQMLILFCPNGCVINGFAHEYEQPDKAALTTGLPVIFTDFIFGEPIKTIGTTFCLWSTEQKKWQAGRIENYDDNSEEMLKIFDGHPQTYIDWATEYFERDYIPLDTVKEIYKGQTLTRKMILSIVSFLDDWKHLETDLDEINYPYDFK